MLAVVGVDPTAMLAVVGVASLALRLPAGQPRIATGSRGLSRCSVSMCSEEKYVNPLTAFLGRFLPKAEAEASDTQDPLAEIDWGAPKADLEMSALVAALEGGLTEREWFVTGRVMPEYFADDFRFQDPDVKLTGIRAYAEGVRRLFDQNSARAELVSCSVNASASEAAGVDVISVTWRLSGGVNIGGLQIKPYLVYTDLQVRDGLVIFQEDRFAIPSWDILLSAIAPWLPFLAEPAPPIEVLRKQIRSSEQ